MYRRTVISTLEICRSPDAQTSSLDRRLQVAIGVPGVGGSHVVRHGWIESMRMHCVVALEPGRQRQKKLPTPFVDVWSWKTTWILQGVCLVRVDWLGNGIGVDVLFNQWGCKHWPIDVHVLPRNGDGQHTVGCIVWHGFCLTKRLAMGTWQVATIVVDPYFTSLDECIESMDYKKTMFSSNKEITGIRYREWLKSGRTTRHSLCCSNCKKWGGNDDFVLVQKREGSGDTQAINRL